MSILDTAFMFFSVRCVRTQALRVVRRWPRGKHRVVWFLETYTLPEDSLAPDSIDDRIALATELWVGWGEEIAQLELGLDENKRRRLQLVRYSAVCPVCAGTVELRYAQGANRRRLVGCCSEVPHEHVFTFDRILRTGRRLMSGVHD